MIRKKGKETSIENYIKSISFINNKNVKRNIPIQVRQFLDSVGVDIDITIDGNKVYCPTAIDLKGLRTVTNGVFIGEIDKKVFKPSHYFFTAFGNQMKNKIDLNSENVNAYLRGEELSFDGKKGYVAVTYDGLTLGGGKVSEGRIKNLYPKGLRNFK